LLIFLSGYDALWALMAQHAAGGGGDVCLEVGLWSSAAVPASAG